MIPCTKCIAARGLSNCFEALGFSCFPNLDLPLTPDLRPLMLPPEFRRSLCTKNRFVEPNKSLLDPLLALLWIMLWLPLLLLCFAELNFETPYVPVIIPAPPPTIPPPAPAPPVFAQDITGVSNSGAVLPGKRLEGGCIIPLEGSPRLAIGFAASPDAPGVPAAARKDECWI